MLRRNRGGATSAETSRQPQGTNSQWDRQDWPSFNEQIARLEQAGYERIERPFQEEAPTILFQKKSEVAEPAPAPGPTSSLETAPDPEAARAKNISNKVVSAFAYGNNGHVNLSPLTVPFVNPPETAREKVISGLADGSIGDREKRELLGAVLGPADVVGGTVHIMQNMTGDRSSDRARKILGYVVGGPDGFNDFRNLDSRNLDAFLAQYPTPLDFEARSTRFLKMISENNSPKKLDEYEAAMSDFKHRVYGEKQDYWEQIQALEAEATSRTTNTRPAPQATKLRATPYYRAPEATPRDPELERTSEWPRDGKGYQQISKTQVRAGIRPDRIDRPGLWTDGTSEDTLLVKSGQKLYGVFDGAGGEGDGRNASLTAANTVDALASQGHPLGSATNLARLLNAADATVGHNTKGYSTATLAEVIDREDGRYLAYAQVGDSRLYLVGRDGTVRQVTRDEGEGNQITNALGMSRNYGGNNNRVAQYGEIRVNDGDRMVICSDGITGDFGSDLMSDRELGSVVQRAGSPTLAANALAMRARKTDDRTVFVTQL